MLRELLNYWWIYIVKGVVALVFGILAITMPEKTVVWVAMLFGLFLIIDGIISSIFALFSIGKGKNWGMSLLIGIIELFLGFLVLNYPQASLGVLLLVVALWLIVVGILVLVMGIKVRDESEDEWLLVAYGLISLFLGIVMLAVPQGSIIFVTIMFGLGAIVNGILNVSFGFKVRELKHRVENGQLELPMAV